MEVKIRPYWTAEAIAARKAERRHRFTRQNIRRYITRRQAGAEIK